MLRLLETVQTSADRIKASRTVAFELVELFLLAVQSFPKKISKGLEFHLWQAVDQVLQTAQLLWNPNFKSWNGNLLKGALMWGKPPKNE
jgi:hypothetical protein